MSTSIKRIYRKLSGGTAYQIEPQDLVTRNRGGRQPIPTGENAMSRAPSKEVIRSLQELAGKPSKKESLLDDTNTEKESVCFPVDVSHTVNGFYVTGHDDILSPSNPSYRVKLEANEGWVRMIPSQSRKRGQATSRASKRYDGRWRFSFNHSDGRPIGGVEKLPLFGQVETTYTRVGNEIRIKVPSENLHRPRQRRTTVSMAPETPAPDTGHNSNPDDSDDIRYWVNGLNTILNRHLCDDIEFSIETETGQTIQLPKPPFKLKGIRIEEIG